MKNFLLNKNNSISDFNKRPNSIGGFTLIELMVSTSIFITIMVMAMGALLAANNTSKRAHQLQTDMDNVNFAMETMTRSLRIGTNYICETSGSGVDLSNGSLLPKDCDFQTSGSEYIAFKPAISMNSSGTPLMAYRKNTQTRADGSTYSSLQRCIIGGVCVDITSSDVDIETLKFYVVGADDSHPQIQPSVYLIMKGSVTIKDEKTSFALQTMASQRTSE